MKYLIVILLLLFSFETSAQFRVRVLPNGKTDPNVGVFQTKEEADAWIAKHVAKNSWGLGERDELDADGNPTGVKLPAQYTITTEDITAEIAAEKAKHDKKAADLQSMAALKDKPVLTNIERDRILLYLLKKELGE